MRACKCPGCGAELNIDDNNRDFAFCQYCGAKIMLDDYRSTQRIVDEARIKEDETKRMVRMRELDMEEQSLRKIEEENKKRNRTNLIIYAISFLFIVVGLIITVNGSGGGILGIFVGGIIAKINYEKSCKYRNKINEMEMVRSGMIKFTTREEDHDGKNYQDVQSAIKKMGFKNITVINMYDLTLGLLSKPGTVDSILIDGKSPDKGEWYNPRAHVEIYYHGFPKDR